MPKSALPCKQKREILKERRKNREKHNIAMIESGVHVESFESLLRKLLLNLSET